MRPVRMPTRQERRVGAWLAARELWGAVGSCGEPFVAARKLIQDQEVNGSVGLCCSRERVKERPRAANPEGGVAVPRTAGRSALVPLAAAFKLLLSDS